MTNKERAEKLAAAAELVLEVMQSLNPRSMECGECHHKRYESFSDHQAHEQLGSAVKRIRDWHRTYRQGSDLAELRETGYIGPGMEKAAAKHRTRPRQAT